MVGCVGEPKGSPDGRPVTPTLHSSPPLIGVSGGELTHLPEGVTMTTQISISNITIHLDAEGRYSLNDLHKASGNERRHEPKNWLNIQQTKELIDEITNTGISVFSPIESKRGCKGGTYVCKELVYAYAMWISAAFSLKVIRAYDEMMASQRQPAKSVQIAPPGRYQLLLTMEGTQVVDTELVAPGKMLIFIADMPELMMRAGYVVMPFSEVGKVTMDEWRELADRTRRISEQWRKDSSKLAINANVIQK